MHATRLAVRPTWLLLEGLHVDACKQDSDTADEALGFRHIRVVCRAMQVPNGCCAADRLVEAKRRLLRGRRDMLLPSQGQR